MFNIIGDIAGNYKTLLALLKKMPDDGEPLSLGDMVDRGPSSKEVVEFFMKNGQAVLGNHEHMMLDYLNATNYYPPRHWMQDDDCAQDDWGHQTMASFMGQSPDQKLNAKYERIVSSVPDDVKEWLRGLPLWIKNQSIDNGTILISHAMVNPNFGLDKSSKLLTKGISRFSGIEVREESIIWNRGRPRPMEGVDLQICGHNSGWGLRWFKKEGKDYAVCIDTSRSDVLTGMHWPSKVIYQQEFID